MHAESAAPPSVPAPPASGWDREFQVIAHRGFSGAFPENTLLAFQRAVRSGAHMLEADVALSSDRRPILIHDDVLDRTTSGSGPVSAQPYATLRELDAGSWFDARFARCRLPSLGEFLRLVKTSRVLANVEIKPVCFDDSLQDDGIERRLLQALEREGVREQVVVSSFEWRILERLRDLEPRLRLGLLSREPLDRLDPAALKAEYNCFSIHPWNIHLNPSFVEACRAAGVRVFAYTSNSYREMELGLHLGIDGIFTNYPDRLLRLAEEFRARTRLLAEQEAAEEQSVRASALADLDAVRREKEAARQRWRERLNGARGLADAAGGL